MAITVGGTNITFNDSTTQSTAAPCKAWVNFNGVTTATIRASYNVSSVVRNAAGDYTVNFTNALADANYTTVGSSMRSDGAVGPYMVGLLWGASTDYANRVSTTSVRIGVNNVSNSQVDSIYIGVAIFR